MLIIHIPECWKIHFCLFNQSEKSPFSSISQHFSLNCWTFFYQPVVDQKQVSFPLKEELPHKRKQRTGTAGKVFCPTGFVDLCELSHTAAAGRRGRPALLLSPASCDTTLKNLLTRTAWNGTSRPTGAARTRREHERTGSLFFSLTLWPDLKPDCLVLFQQAFTKKKLQQPHKHQQAAKHWHQSFFPFFFSGHVGPGRWVQLPLMFFLLLQHRKLCCFVTNKMLLALKKN